MTESIITDFIRLLTENAHTWGFLIIFVFMTIESSFIPFPSEIIMIPAGFMAYRGDLTFGSPLTAMMMAIFVGLLGSMAGAYINYYLAYKLGRPLLHKYGKYFFLPEKKLDRAEELFRHYGELTTFVCRLLPAIRQLISIPAGLVKMNFWRFSFFTALGAGIWVVVLTLLGWYFGHLAGESSYEALAEKGKKIISDNYLWLFLGLAAVVVIYLLCERIVMNGKIKTNSSSNN
ncbi:MAG: DedA family protein [Lentisphaeria bacterium]|nr:DedA family protein [Lentisphaeria bacterium]